MRRVGNSIVFCGVQLVILMPRWIVRRRVPASEVADVRRLDGHDVAMVSPEVYRVERILVQGSLRRPPRSHLRVTWRDYWIADSASIAQVGRHVDLATLNDAE